jgi:xanthine dehydrogenase accessory factor
MKETRDILKAYAATLSEGRKAALATVVKVEGSSYRQPGARMLISEDGSLTGAVSGGCLEGDVLRKALLAMARNQSMLITYDTSDDTILGAGLGCNGIIHILIEPVDEKDPLNPLKMLELAMQHRQPYALLTFFDHAQSQQPGTCALTGKDKMIAGNLPAGTDKKKIMQAIREAFERKTAVILENCLVGMMLPVPQLLIAGAGNDVMPLVNMAEQLGWHIAIVDGRPGYATCARFPAADEIVVSDAKMALSGIFPDEYTSLLLMSHNYQYDLAILRQLESYNIPYIGILGPRKKCERLLAEPGLENIRKDRVYGPVGLDTGAETAEEIALSVLAEIKAVFSGRTGKPLRDKTSPIHRRLAEPNAAKFNPL